MNTLKHYKVPALSVLIALCPTPIVTNSRKVTAIRIAYPVYKIFFVDYVNVYSVSTFEVE